MLCSLFSIGRHLFTEICKIRTTWNYVLWKWSGMCRVTLAILWNYRGCDTCFWLHKILCHQGIHFQPLFFEYMALASVWTLQYFVEHHFLGSIFGYRFVLSIVGCMLYDCCKFLRNFSLVYVLHVSSQFISVTWIIPSSMPENAQSLRLHICHHLLYYVTHNGHCHTASL
jgi:hypothetical protein